MVAQTFDTTNLNFVRYPRFKELHKEIMRCQEISKKSLEPQCMALEGKSGAGKSILTKDYASMFPRIETENGIVVPVFYAEIPSPATVKGTAASLLEQLGDPGSAKGTLWAMNSKLIGLIKSCGVLKMLIKQTGVPFVVVGIEGKVSRILKANAQLSRLFACREKLEPFTWGDGKSIQEFSLFVQYAEKAVELSMTSDIPKVELYYRIFYATNGVVGNIMNLMRYAGINAKDNKHDKIELADLSDAFRKRINEHLYDKTNPFIVSASEGFETPVEIIDNSKISKDIDGTLTTR
jgi:hypothetical protein